MIQPKVRNLSTWAVLHVMTALSTAIFCATSARASEADGLYLTPNAEVILVDKAFTKGTALIGIGGGGGLVVGYQKKNFQIELAANYQYYGGKSIVNQLTNAFSQYSLYQRSLNTTVDNYEYFLPVTLGLNYVIPVNASGSLAITPGIAGGVWFHEVKRSLSYSSSDPDVSQKLNQFFTNQLDTKLNPVWYSFPANDQGSEIKAVIVPSLSLDYSPSSNFTLRVAGKLYIVPAGYSDNYSATTQAVIAAADKINLPAYSAVNKLFWYGALHVGAQYTF